MTSPKRTGQLDPTTYKGNLQIRVSDPDVPEGPSKDSFRLDASEIRPKTVDWDLSGPSPLLPGNINNGDHLRVIGPGEYNSVTYGTNAVALVIDAENGIVLPLNPALGGYPVLLTFDITSPYPQATAEGQVYTRTAFTSGDLVNFSFTASEPINKIAIWPFDSVMQFGAPTGNPILVDVSGDSGTGSFVIPGALAGDNAYIASGSLFVAARVFGDNTDIIQSTTAFKFDNREPSLNLQLGSPTYPIGQSAIKSNETVSVTVELDPDLTKYLKGVKLTNEPLTAVTPTPVNGVHDVATLSTFNFTASRNTTEFNTTNGVVSISLKAYNGNNNKSKTEIVTFHVESGVFAEPTIIVNAGDAVVTKVGGQSVLVEVESEVRLSDPGATISLVGGTFTGSWSQSLNGYRWTRQATIADAAIRGANDITATGFLTAAGSPITIDQEYTVSGFENRAVFFAAPFSVYAPFVGVTVDNEPGLVVRSIVGATINPILYSYDALNNRLVVDPSIADLNATGTMYLNVSQAPLP